MADEHHCGEDTDPAPSIGRRVDRGTVTALQPLAECALAVSGVDLVRIVLEDGSVCAETGSLGKHDFRANRRTGIGATPDHGDADLAVRRPEPAVRHLDLIGTNEKRLGSLILVGGPPASFADQGAPALRHLAHAAAIVIEQQAEVEAALRRARDAFLLSPSPSWIYDMASLRFLDVNEAAISFYGYTREQFLSMTVLDIRPPEERQRMLDAVRGLSDLDGAATWRHWRADGQPVDVITHGRGITVEGVPAVVVVAIDRTDVLALRQDLSTTQMVLDTIIDALPNGLFVKDMEDDGRFVVMNPAAARLIGRTPDEVLGLTPVDVFGPDLGGKFSRQDREIMASGRLHAFDNDDFIDRNGENRQIHTIFKPLPAAAGQAPRYLLGISEDVTERRRSAERVARMAHYDFLTGLPNRVLFQQHLDRMVKRRRKSGGFALFYVDLDFFKTINDTYGHQIGDSLLTHVAGRLSLCLRRRDMVARLGGDEFAIVASISGGETEAQAFADRILKSFDAPFDLGGIVAHIDTSIGIALSGSPDDGPTEEMMRRADIALYAAKAEGRGIAKVYVSAMSQNVEERQRTSEDLRLGLAQNQFELDFQPLWNLARGKITGFEALIRWRHPSRGLISPGDFIPVAEQTGLIVPIGEWVMREACQLAARWPDTIKIAVNLSVVQFKKPDIVESIERTLAETGLRPDRLELEITESVLLTDSGPNLQILHRLKRLGVRIAMDDFGTGYSSLSYLRSFPFDKIKMDRSFVADVSDSDESLAIIRAVTGLGSSLSITTTAEGVETAEQFARLKAEGFDELQGYFIGRPMTADKATRLALAQDGLALDQISAA